MRASCTEDDVPSVQDADQTAPFAGDDVGDARVGPIGGLVVDKRFDEVLRIRFQNEVVVCCDTRT